MRKTKSEIYQQNGKERKKSKERYSWDSMARDDGNELQVTTVRCCLTSAYPRPGLGHSLVRHDMKPRTAGGMQMKLVAPAERYTSSATWEGRREPYPYMC